MSLSRVHKIVAAVTQASDFTLVDEKEFEDWLEQYFKDQGAAYAFCQTIDREIRLSFGFWEDHFDSYDLDEATEQIGAWVKGELERVTTLRGYRINEFKCKPDPRFFGGGLTITKNLDWYGRAARIIEIEAMLQGGLGGVEVSEFVWHVTYRDKLDKIQTKGLLPMRGGKEGSFSVHTHSPRVYFFTSRKEALNHTGLFERDGREVIILKVRSGGRVFHKDYREVKIRNGVWTEGKVPASAIVGVYPWRD